MQEKRQKPVAVDGTSLVAPLGGSVSAGRWGEFTIIFNWLQCMSFQSCQKSQVWHKLSIARQKFSCLSHLTSSGCVSETHCKAPGSDSYLLVGKSSLSWLQRPWLFMLSYLSVTCVQMAAAPRRCSGTAHFVPSVAGGLATPLQAEAPLRTSDPKMLQGCPRLFSHLNLPL